MNSEINDETMFELKLMGEMDFHRQRGTILTWKDKKEEDDDDTAISFQDKEGIREVWYGYDNPIFYNIITYRLIL